MTGRVEITMTATDEFGIPSRMGRLHPLPGESDWEAVEAELRERGCGAWRGRTGCDDPASWLALGGGGLLFLTYRAVYGSVDGAMAVLCDRHAGPLWQIARDMPRPLRRAQERDFRDLLRRFGMTDLEDVARLVTLLPLEREGP
jgi:hypothetical protein